MLSPLDLLSLQIKNGKQYHCKISLYMCYYILLLFLKLQPDEDHFIRQMRRDLGRTWEKREAENATA